MTTINQHVREFENKQCETTDQENVLSFLRHIQPKSRFSPKVIDGLSELIFNLKAGDKFLYKVGNGHTVRALLRDKMRCAGLIEWDRGYNMKERCSKKSTVQPTLLFTAVVKKYCQLKHGGGHIGYWGDIDTINELIWGNSFLSRHHFSYVHGDLNPLIRFNYLPTGQDNQVTRQRLINDVHTLKKTVRPTIKIDGVPTIQHDVKATHPQLLLHRYLRKPMLFDPYDIAPNHKYAKHLRQAAKIAFMMMLNNSSKKSAGAAFRKSLKDEDNEKIRIAVDRYTQTKSHILDAVYELNPLLQEFFYCGMYRELMHMDGSIAWSCMMELARKNIPSLTVHDEIIVQPQHQQIALEAYKQCWIEVTGINGLNIEPIIVLKKCPLDGESKK